MKYGFSTSTLVLMLSAFFWIGCGTTPTEPDDKEKGSSNDNSFAQNEFDEIARAFNTEASLSPTLNKIEATSAYFCNGATLDVADNGNGTYTMTMDFGSGTTCTDQKKREGKLVGVFNGKWNVAGSKVTITPQNYFVTTVSGTKYGFEFTKTITNLGVNTSNFHEYNTKITNATLTSTSGTILWESDRTVEWVDGYGSDDPTTYKYNIKTGTASGTATNGVQFTAEITSPLVVDNSCQYRIIKGILEITPLGAAKRVIDYGDGTCDDKATLSIGSFTSTLVLR